MERPKQLLATTRARIDKWQADFLEAREMPVVTINLMYKRTVDNHIFYRELTKRWYDEVTAPHPRLCLANRMWRCPNPPPCQSGEECRRASALVARVVHTLEWGVAVCTLPRTHDEYFKFIESSARRNAKKARRQGYRCQPFTLTEDFVDDVRAIHQSTDVRQGKVTEEILSGPVQAIDNPPSRTPYHAYPYCGVFLDDQLVAYSSCFVAGELASVERIFGHAEHQAAGVVPMLLAGMSEILYENHPAVRYLVYGSYFGSSPTMRRFKKKFRMFPHRVHWRLDTRETAD